jgi:cytochrome c oxidase cbb3-type subunit 3
MQRIHTATALLLAASLALAQQGRGGRGAANPAPSPAARRPPATVTPQSYPAEQIEAGRARFASQCGFCHGRDAQGGESGPDLTRSMLVAEDVRGDKIEPLLRTGRPAQGMPAFTLSAADAAAIVAFLHDAKTKAETVAGGRRTVDPEDLATGDAEAGRAYFNGAGGCARCHAISGAFATVGARFQGLALLQRMLYPPLVRVPGAPPAVPTVTVTTAGGQTISGKLAYRDEFSITLTDAQGWTRSWPVSTVQVTLDDPLKAHTDQLPKYTDEDIHNLVAYLQTLR